MSKIIILDLQVEDVLVATNWPSDRFRCFEDLFSNTAITMFIWYEIRHERFGLQDIVVESDCQMIWKLTLFNILASCVCFKSIVWSHVKRDGNFVAHHLARINPFGVEQIWENYYPPEVAPYVLMDVLSLAINCLLFPSKKKIRHERDTSNRAVNLENQLNWSFDYFINLQNFRRRKRLTTTQGEGSIEDVKKTIREAYRIL